MSVYSDTARKLTAEEEELQGRVDKFLSAPGYVEHDASMSSDSLNILRKYGATRSDLAKELKAEQDLRFQQSARKELALQADRQANDEKIALEYIKEDGIIEIYAAQFEEANNRQATDNELKHLMYKDNPALLRNPKAVKAIDDYLKHTLNAPEQKLEAINQQIRKLEADNKYAAAFLASAPNDQLNAIRAITTDENVAKLAEHESKKRNLDYFNGPGKDIRDGWWKGKSSAGTGASPRGRNVGNEPDQNPFDAAPESPGEKYPLSPRSARQLKLQYRTSKTPITVQDPQLLMANIQSSAGLMFVMPNDVGTELRKETAEALNITVEEVNEAIGLLGNVDGFKVITDPENSDASLELPGIVEDFESITATYGSDEWLRQRKTGVERALRKAREVLQMGAAITERRYEKQLAEWEKDQWIKEAKYLPDDFEEMDNQIRLQVTELFDAAGKNDWGDMVGDNANGLQLLSDYVIAQTAKIYEKSGIPVDPNTGLVKMSTSDTPSGGGFGGFEGLWLQDLPHIMKQSKYYTDAIWKNDEIKSALGAGEGANVSRRAMHKEAIMGWYAEKLEALGVKVRREEEKKEALKARVLGGTSGSSGKEDTTEKEPTEQKPSD